MKGPRQDLPAVAPCGIPPKLPADLIATGMVEKLQQIQAALAPVIGRGGVAALYERSRHLSSRSHSWLAAPADSLGQGIDLEEIKLLIAQQSDSAAEAGSRFLLKSFHDLLAGLVGGSLTRQLIGPTPGSDSEVDSAP